MVESMIAHCLGNPDDEANPDPLFQPGITRLDRGRVLGEFMRHASRWLTPFDREMQGTITWAALGVRTEYVIDVLTRQPYHDTFSEEAAEAIVSALHDFLMREVPIICDDGNIDSGPGVAVYMLGDNGSGMYDYLWDADYPSLAWHTEHAIESVLFSSRNKVAIHSVLHGIYELMPLEHRREAWSDAERDFDTKARDLLQRVVTHPDAHDVAKAGAADVLCGEHP